MADGTEKPYFILGLIDSPHLLRFLHHFVSETEHIRELARKDSVSDVLQAVRGSTIHLEFRGTATYDRDGKVDASFLHGVVFDALASELERLGIDRSNERLGRIAPDLYTLDPGRKMDILFEIKTDCDPHSVYTGIGQLMVYGAGHEPLPRRVLVLPGKPISPNFLKALQSLGICVLAYSTDGEEVRFSPEEIETCVRPQTCDVVSKSK